MATAIEQWFTIGNLAQPENGRFHNTFLQEVLGKQTLIRPSISLGSNKAKTGKP
jgi:hypothetical protein